MYIIYYVIINFIIFEQLLKIMLCHNKIRIKILKISKNSFISCNQLNSVYDIMFNVLKNIILKNHSLKNKKKLFRIIKHKPICKNNLWNNEKK